MLNQRRLEEAGTHGEVLLAMFTKGRKSISSSLTKRRLTSQAKAKLEKEKEDVEFAIKNLSTLQEEMKAAIAKLDNDWKGKINEVTEIKVSPLKKDIFIELFGIAWVPYYLVEIDGRTQRICAFNR